MSYVPYVTLKFTLPQVTVLAGPKERGIVLYCKGIETCAVESKYSYVTRPTISILLYFGIYRMKSGRSRVRIG